MHPNVKLTEKPFEQKLFPNNDKPVLNKVPNKPLFKPKDDISLENTTSLIWGMGLGMGPILFIDTMVIAMGRDSMIRPKLIATQLFQAPKPIHVAYGLKYGATVGVGMIAEENPIFQGVGMGFVNNAISQVTDRMAISNYTGAPVKMGTIASPATGWFLMSDIILYTGTSYSNKNCKDLTSQVIAKGALVVGTTIPHVLGNASVDGEGMLSACKRISQSPLLMRNLLMARLLRVIVTNALFFNPLMMLTNR